MLMEALMGRAQGERRQSAGCRDFSAKTRAQAGAAVAGADLLAHTHPPVDVRRFMELARLGSFDMSTSSPVCPRLSRASCLLAAPRTKGVDGGNTPAMPPAPWLA